MTKIGRTLAALGGALTLLLAGTGIAEARFGQIADGFESNPGALWHIETLGSGQGGFDYDNGTQRTGRGNGWLHSGYTSSAAAAMGLWAYMGNGGISHCRVQAQVNPLNDRSQEIVIEARESATGITNSGLRYLAYPGYQEISLEFDLAGYKSVYVRFLLTDSGRGFDGEWVRIDDFVFTCWP
ncbi:hypothetical protein [Amycolatopsis plumensis]|uniref:Uncharacterized protein n=1 Tax=Amycolatopsis plumensis TaxID=236508 RepID=A0ABV5UBA0_9PSEU